ncbi:MAG: signal recognition particle receptor subunit alpha, partial [Deltaproteobacteria bacterium]|nr:signal recognition particle receptor subunit alpha [Deltaproteobacteria bacterium]
MLKDIFVKDEMMIKTAGVGDIVFLIILLGFALLIILALYKKFVRKDSSRYEARPAKREREELKEEEKGREEDSEKVAEDFEEEESVEEKEEIEEVKPEPPPIKVEELAKPVHPKSLKEGLKKTHDGFISRLNRIFFSSKSITRENIEAIEEVLFTSDVGVKTSQRLLDFLNENLTKKELEDAEKMRDALKQKIKEMVKVD